jgi:hypothetical protein
MEQAAVGQNWIATAALMCWPLVGCLLYRTLSSTQATIWTVLGAYLILPTGATVKIATGVPPFDKPNVTAIAVLVGALLFGRRRLTWNRFSITEVVLLVLVLSPFITSLLNDDSVLGSVMMPPLGIYDGLSAVAAQFLFVVPFLVSSRLLRSMEDVEAVLRTLVISAALYSLPVLLEIRVSPQLNRMVYGFYPFQFDELVRSGGFRPAVFIGHGLAVSFFMMTAVTASAALWRARIKLFNFANSAITTYLGSVLVLCKSLGAVIYAGFASLLVLYSKPRLQVRLALVLALFALAYPLLRSADLVPTEQVLSWASTISKDRADSLQVRFDNEKQLLQRALLRPTFGWGRWGRSRIYNEYGKDISITDGRWIITLGQFGFVGFLAEFGLLSLCVIRAASALKLIKNKSHRIIFGALTLILAINIFDLLPNSALTPWTWLIAGTLLGVADQARRPVKQMQSQPALDLGSKSQLA